MAWSQTDTGIQYSSPESLTTPTFSATAATAVIEREQWKRARECADYLIKHKAVGTPNSITATHTITLSGTSTTGHGNNDTVTVTVTMIGQ